MSWSRPVVMAAGPPKLHQTSQLARLHALTSAFCTQYADTENDNLLMGAVFSDWQPDVLCLCDQLGGLQLVRLHHNGAQPDTTAFSSQSGVRNGCVFDVSWLAPHLVLAAAADGVLRVCDVHTLKVIRLFGGHEQSIKSVNANPYDPHTFVSGCRGGRICVHDVRQRARYPASQASRPVNQISHAHDPCSEPSQVLDKNASALRQYRQQLLRTPNRAAGKRKTPSSGSKRGSGTGSQQLSVTDVLYTQQHMIASCSMAASSGIRLWDVRKSYTHVHQKPNPQLILDYGGSMTGKGFASLSVDRLGARLYALCTDGGLYEYELQKADVAPSRCFKCTGVVSNSFYCRARCHPLNDQVLLGAAAGRAIVYDTRYEQAVLLAGHDDNVEVSSVSWSCRGDWLCTGDDVQYRLWTDDQYTSSSSSSSQQLNNTDIPNGLAHSVSAKPIDCQVTRQL